MTKRHRITIIAATLVAISLGELYLLQHLFERRRSAVIRQLESDLRTERERTQSLFKMQSAISAAAEHRQKYLAVIPVEEQPVYGATCFSHVATVNEEICVSFHHIDMDSQPGGTFYSINVYLRNDLSLSRIVHASESE